MPLARSVCVIHHTSVKPTTTKSPKGSLPRKVRARTPGIKLRYTNTFVCVHARATGVHSFYHAAYPGKCPWTIYSNGVQVEESLCAAIGDIKNGDTIVLVFNKAKGTLTLERDGKPLLTQPLRLTPGSKPTVGDIITVMPKHEQYEFREKYPPRRGKIILRTVEDTFMVDFGNNTRPRAGSTYEEVDCDHVKQAPVIPKGVVPFVTMTTMNKITVGCDDDVRFLIGQVVVIALFDSDRVKRLLSQP